MVKADYGLRKDEIMYKLIFILIFLLSKSLCSYSQCLDSLVSIKGYYITQFSKDEISFSYDQKIKKTKGESHSLSVDFKQISFFVPTQINHVSTIGEENIVQHFSTDRISKDSIFYIPTDKNIEKYIKRMFDLEIDMSRENCILSEAMRISPYYVIDGDDKYIYKCIYIEGCAKQKTIQNEEKERFRINLDTYSINRKSPYLNLFFVTEIKSYNPIIDIPKLKRWLPYL